MKKQQEIDLAQYYQAQIEEKAEHRFLDQLYDQQHQLHIDKKIEKRPNEPFKCDCEICKYGVQEFKSTKHLNNHGKVQIYEDFNPSKQLSNNFQSEKDLVFVLRRLQPPNKNVRSLRIYLPETFCLNGGEVKFLAFMSKEKIDKKEFYFLKYLVKKEKLTFPHLRRFLAERRIKMKNQEPGEQQQDFQSNEVKTIDSKYREAVLVKFTDNNVQVLAEYEFLLLMMRRRIDPIWNQIQYVQNYVIPKKMNFELIQIKFEHSKDRWNTLFDRAKIEILIIIGEIAKASEDYVSIEKEEEFEKTLSGQDYCKFITYKIWHYMELIALTKIISGHFQYLQDQNDNYNLLNVQNLQSTEAQKKNFIDLENAQLFKSKKIEITDVNEDSRRFTQLLKKERDQAAKIYKDLIYNDFVSSAKDMNFVKRNILRVTGEEFTHKQQKKLFLANSKTFRVSIDPLGTLKELIQTHQTDEEKRRRIFEGKTISLDQKSKLEGKTYQSIPGISLKKSSHKIGSQKIHGTYSLLPQTSKATLRS